MGYWNDMDKFEKVMLTVVVLPILALSIVGLPIVVMTIMDIIEDEKIKGGD